MKTIHLSMSLVLAGAALAQEHANPTPLGQPVEGPFGVPTLARAHGELRASGRHYEAVFENGGVTFLPVLGSVAPEVQSFTFTFASAQRGEETLATADAATLSTEGLSAKIQRSPSLVEVYDVHSAGLKQSFVFGESFGGRGDLIVRGRIDTPLPLPNETADGGLAFVHPVWGGVQLGAVVGYDHTGAEVQGSMQMHGDILEMRLPAAFVDTATWPITLDPLVGTVLPANVDANDAVDPAAASSNDGEVLLTFTRRFSLNSARIRGQRVLADGTNVGSVLFLTNETFSVDSAVGYNEQLDNWLVAYEVRNDALSPADILARTVQPNGSVSGPFNVATGSSNQNTPSVASDGRGTDDECLVVWAQQGFGLRARQVRPLDGGPAASPTVSLTTDSQDSNPAVSQNCGTTGRCLVAFQRGGEVRAKRITINATVLGSSMAVASGASKPACDGDGVTAMVVYEKPEPGNFFDGDIFARTFSLFGTGAKGPEFPVDDDANSDETEPAIAFLGPNVVVAYSDQFATSSTNYDIVGKTIDLNRCTVCGPTFSNGFTTANGQRDVVITSFLSGAASSGSEEGMMFWLERPNSNGDILGRRFTALGAGGTSQTISPSCGLGGTLSTSSSLSVGSDLVLQLQGADPAAQAGFLLLREPNTALFGCGICQAVIPAIVLNETVIGGGFSTTIPIPCDMTLNGGQFDWQAAVLGTSQTPCTLLPGGAFSNVLRTTIGL